MNTRRPENAAMDNNADRRATRVLPLDAEPQLLSDPSSTAAAANLAIDADWIAEAGEPVEIGLTGKSGGPGRTLALNTAIVAGAISTSSVACWASCAKL